MARARNIKPKFFTNEDLAELPYEGRLLFIGLWCLADREGRLEDRPKKIKMEVFPADSVDVDRLLQKLHDGGFILRYGVEEKRYIQILAFEKHQSPHFKEPPSTIPKPGVSPQLNGGRNPGNGQVAKEVKPEVSPPLQGGRTALIPDSGLPDPGLRNPESPSPSTSSAAAGRRAAQEAKATRTRPAREAYSRAYERRWEVEPTWDRQANSCMAAFVEKVGVDDAPGIAEFYVTHSRQDYIRAKHDVTLLLRDARGLRTEWLTGRKVTDTEAREADRTGATADQVNRLIAEAGRSR